MEKKLMFSIREIMYRGRTYRGENQEQYICLSDQKQILICLVGE